MRLSSLKPFFGCCVAMLLASCSGNGPPRGPANSSFNGIPAGSLFLLERPLTIPPDRVRAFIPRNYQPWRDQGAYAPHCDLEVWTKHPQRFRVEPDRFRITGIRGGFTPILVRTTQPVRIAANGGPFGFLARGGDEGTSFLRSYVEMYIHSPRQPDVYRVNCSYMGDPFDMRLLTLREIRLALRGTARLLLPGEEEAVNTAPPPGQDSRTP